MIDLDGLNGLEDLIDSDVGICEGVIALPKSLVKELITSLHQADKDAARYRWLRNEASMADMQDFSFSLTSERDAFMDEAMNASNN